MKRTDYGVADEVATAIDAAIIAYQPFTDVVKALLRIAESPIQRGLLTVGESRVGKSTTAEVVCRDLNGRAPAGEHWALTIEIPTNPTEKSIAKELMLALGNERVRRSEQDLTASFVKIARETGLKLVIIDEFHHFVEGRRGVTNLDRAANSLKGLMNRTKPMSYVIMGLPKSMRIMHKCQQLRGRFSACIELEILGRAVLEEVSNKQVVDRSYKHYLNVVRTLTQVLPFSNAETLFTTELGRRLLSASQGRLGYIKPLLIGAVELACERREGKLSDALLEAAFTRYIWQGGVGGKNPFNRYFDFSDRLDGPGEPFAPDGEW